MGLNDHLKRQAIKSLIPVVKENMPVVGKVVTTFLESIPYVREKSMPYKSYIKHQAAKQRLT